MQLFKVKNFVWSLIKKISNLNFALFLLLIIIILSTLGTLIEQDQSIAFYKFNYPISYIFFNWQIILFLGLNHIYETWWFILVISIFALCLACCSLSVQLPSLKNARRWKFRDQRISNQKFRMKQSCIQNYNKGMNSICNMLYTLNDNGYFVFHKQDYIYSYKGLIGRIAPIFVHLSILCALFGFLISILTNFIDQEMVSSGEIFHLKNVVHAGKISHLNRNFVGRVDNFFIDYNSDDSIKQFFSEITLLNNQGISIVNQTISVNSPLLFQDMTIYQTDWSIDALKMKIGDISLQTKLQKVEINNKICWISDFIIKGTSRFFVIVFRLDNKLYLYDINKNTVSAIILNDFIEIDNISLSIQDIMVSTGLQIKADQGIQIVYVGFLMIMISTVISYISYSQIWITIESQVLYMAGTTNRAILLFEEEISKISNVYQSYCLWS